MDYKVGQQVTYKIVDMETYSRGYGVFYETKTSEITEICFKMANGDTISVRNIEKANESEKKEPKKESTQ